MCEARQLAMLALLQLHDEPVRKQQCAGVACERLLAQDRAGGPLRHGDQILP